MTRQTRMDPEMLSMVLDTINKLENNRITLETKLEMDEKGEFPEELIRFMLGPDMALHLIFVPEEYGGLGAGATEIAVVSERMAKMDLAVATSFLAICLGMDPIRVGATPEQKEKYIRKIAEEGLVVAYGVTEPEAGSNVQSLKTRADRVLDEAGVDVLLVKPLGVTQVLFERGAPEGVPAARPGGVPPPEGSPAGGVGAVRRVRGDDPGGQHAPLLLV